MTATEAIDNLEYLISEDCTESQFGFIPEIEMAIEALETIAELEKRGITVDTINEYKIFEDECVRKGFTFESLLEAREKQTPKKPIKSDREIRYCEVWKCPECGFEWSSRVVDYCYKCGQKIDWSEEE